MGGVYMQIQTEQEQVFKNTIPKQLKIIKKYQNRKLYDTERSAYVTLDDISQFVRLNLEFVVIDNLSKSDITAETLIQIIFDNERKAQNFMPIPFMTEIIKTKSGISNFMLKMEFFKEEQMVTRSARSKVQQTTNQDHGYGLLPIPISEISSCNFVEPRAENFAKVEINPLPIGLNN